MIRQCLILSILVFVQCCFSKLVPSENETGNKLSETDFMLDSKNQSTNPSPTNNSSPLSLKSQTTSWTLTDTEIQIIIGCASGTVLIVLITVCWCCTWKRKKENSSNGQNEYSASNQAFVISPKLDKGRANPSVYGGDHDRLMSVISLQSCISQSDSTAAIFEEINKRVKQHSITSLSDNSISLREDNAFIGLNSLPMRNRLYNVTMQLPQNDHQRSQFRQNTGTALYETTTLEENRSQNNVEENESHYLSDYDLQRYASTDQYLKPLQLSDTGTENHSKGQYEEPIREENEDDNDYTDVCPFKQKSNVIYVEDPQDKEYSVIYDNHASTEKLNSSIYEVPEKSLDKAIGRDDQPSHYLNLNAKLETKYGNLEYEVPITNPTEIDAEEVYVEFIQ